MLSFGDVLAGKYRVERVLGEGGFGVVVEAEHLVLGGRVAIKVLKPEAALQPGVVARFLREARAAAQIQSEHVARVLDVGSAPGGTPYLVMENLRGNDLAKVVGTRGALPVATAVDHILQTCLALAEAHALGIVHRDIKPSNLFVTARPDGSPCIKVLDFGIAKAMPKVEGAPSLTRTQEVVGTPLYMAPEQMRSARSVDARTDVWAVGATLYELLAGEPAFGGDTISDIYAAVLTDTPKPLGPAVPPGLTAVIARCLEKQPARRYPDIATLAAALAPFGSGRVQSMPAVGVQTALASDAGKPGPMVDTLLAVQHHTVALGTVATTPPPRRWHATIGVMLALAALAGGALVLARVRAVRDPAPVASLNAEVPIPSAPTGPEVSATVETMPTTTPSALPAKTAARTQKRTKGSLAAPAPESQVESAPAPPPAASSAPRGVATSRFE